MITVLFGPPGSGKGTQAAVVAVAIGVPHVSTGAILRAEVAGDTELGREAGPLMAGGNLVPDDLMVRVIEARLSQPDARGGAILDGFPRTVPQAEALDAMLTRRGWAISCVIVLDVPDDVLLERILGRARAEGRSDDSPEAFQNRLAVYTRDTAPVLDHYARSGVRIEHVDGVGEVAEITGRISKVLSGSGDGVPR